MTPFRYVFSITAVFILWIGQSIAFGQNASPSIATSKDDQYSYLTTDKLSEADQKALIDARKAVWEAWFSADEAKIKELMPAETIVADPHDGQWIGRDEIIARSKGFAETNGKLTKLQFPQNRIQVYGPVVILYIRYSLAYEIDGEETAMEGRCTEVFVKRDNRWLNTAWHLDEAK